MNSLEAHDFYVSTVSTILHNSIAWKEAGTFPNHKDSDFHPFVVSTPDFIEAYLRELIYGVIVDSSYPNEELTSAVVRAALLVMYYPTAVFRSCPNLHRNLPDNRYRLVSKFNRYRDVVLTRAKGISTGNEKSLSKDSTIAVIDFPYAVVSAIYGAYLACAETYEDEECYTKFRWSFRDEYVIFDGAPAEKMMRHHGFWRGSVKGAVLKDSESLMFNRAGFSVLNGLIAGYNSDNAVEYPEEDAVAVTVPDDDPYDFDTWASMITNVITAIWSCENLSLQYFRRVMTHLLVVFMGLYA